MKDYKHEDVDIIQYLIDVGYTCGNCDRKVDRKFTLQFVGAQQISDIYHRYNVCCPYCAYKSYAITEKQFLFENYLYKFKITMKEC